MKFYVPQANMPREVWAGFDPERDLFQVRFVYEGEDEEQQLLVGTLTTDLGSADAPQEVSVDFDHEAQRLHALSCRPFDPANQAMVTKFLNSLESAAETYRERTPSMNMGSWFAIKSCVKLAKTYLPRLIRQIKDDIRRDTRRKG